jgi:anti-sigma factor RsiW
MDCKGFRKYVGAFADSELGVAHNLEALEHLNMCPRCAERVGDITSLKTALKRVYGDLSAPPRLRDRILASLDTGVATPQREHLSSVGRSFELRYRWMIPLGMAAALLLGVFAYYEYRPKNEPQYGAITVVTGQPIADIREQHRACVGSRGLAHHDVSLTRDPSEIAKRLSGELALTVVVPDLSARGFELVGADRCGILGRRGAHVLYRLASAGPWLSVFTVARLPGLWAALGDSPPYHNNDRRYFVSGEESLTVVAWHDGRQTYAFCGRMPKPDLLALAEQIRTASAMSPHPASRPSQRWPVFRPVLAQIP